MIDNGYNAKERGPVAANEAFFNEETTRKYADVSPHVKYASLRRLYGRLVEDVYAHAREHAEVPTVLDLGAGEGSATLPFLESTCPRVNYRNFEENVVHTRIVWRYAKPTSTTLFFQGSTTTLYS